MMLLQKSNGYGMEPSDKREIKRTQSLFINDLKTYQQNQQNLNMKNGILRQASMDAGAIWCKNVLKLYLKMVG